jgi:hypothetical protein
VRLRVIGIAWLQRTNLSVLADFRACIYEPFSTHQGKKKCSGFRNIFTNTGQNIINSYLCVFSSDTVSFFLPLARRAASTRRPFAEAILSRKPCLFFLFLTDGWNVRNAILLMIYASVHRRINMLFLNSDCKDNNFFNSANYFLLFQADFLKNMKKR